MLPDFYDFIAQIDEDRLAKMINAKNPELPHFAQFDFSDPAARNDLLRMISEKIVIRAQSVALCYLQLYYEWLADWLSKNQE